jgi:NADH-ubiquinone oxidoreductase-F iron-sulfur binding region
MKDKEFFLIAVSSHKQADDFFKKFKLELDKQLKGKAFVMRAPLIDEGDTMLQVYPHDIVYSKVTPEDIADLVQSLVDRKPLERLEPTKSHYVADLASLLRLNMQATELNICGKCSPCRIGGPLITELLARYEDSSFDKLATKNQLLDVGITMKNASMCAIGMFGADPVLFALEKWPNYFIQKQGV